jgi:hypothetical protein
LLAFATARYRFASFIAERNYVPANRTEK